MTAILIVCAIAGVVLSVPTLVSLAQRPRIDRLSRAAYETVHTMHSDIQSLPRGETFKAELTEYLSGAQGALSRVHGPLDGKIIWEVCVSALQTAEGDERRIWITRELVIATINTIERGDPRRHF